MCRNYTLAPSEAWRELGREPLGPRGRLRLTRAVSELQFVNHALEEVSRERGPKEKMPDVAEVLAAKEAADLYALDLASVLTDDPDEVVEAAPPVTFVDPLVYTAPVAIRDEDRDY